MAEQPQKVTITLALTNAVSAPAAAVNAALRGIDATARALGRSAAQSLAPLRQGLSLGGMLGGFASGFAVVAAFRKGLDEARKQAQAIAGLRSALGGDIAMFGELADQAESFAAKLGQSKSSVLAVQAQLLNRGVPGTQVRDATQASADVAAALGLDLQSAGEAIAITYGGTVTRQLGRAVPALKELSEAELKAGEGAALLEARFKGFAAAQAATPFGQIQVQQAKMEQSWVRIGNVLVKLEAQIFPALSVALEQMANTLQGLSDRGELQGLADGAILIVRSIASAFELVTIAVAKYASTVREATGDLGLDKVLKTVIDLKNQWNEGTLSIKTLAAEIGPELAVIGAEIRTYLFDIPMSLLDKLDAKLHSVFSLGVTQGPALGSLERREAQDKRREAQLKGQAAAGITNSSTPFDRMMADRAAGGTAADYAPSAKPPETRSVDQIIADAKAKLEAEKAALRSTGAAMATEDEKKTLADAGAKERDAARSRLAAQADDARAQTAKLLSDQDDMREDDNKKQRDEQTKLLDEELKQGIISLQQYLDKKQALEAADADRLAKAQQRVADKLKPVESDLAEQRGVRAEHVEAVERAKSDQANPLVSDENTRQAIADQARAEADIDLIDVRIAQDVEKQNTLRKEQLGITQAQQDLERKIFADRQKIDEETIKKAPGDVKQDAQHVNRGFLDRSTMQKDASDAVADVGTALDDQLSRVQGMVGKKIGDQIFSQEDADAVKQRIRASADEARETIQEELTGIETVSHAMSDVADAARTDATRGLGNALTSIELHAKSVKQALYDMVQGFAQAMLNVINQKLAEQLVGNLIGFVGGAIGGAGAADAGGGFSAGAAGGGFAAGGYTGGGHVSEVAGTVHRREYVIPAGPTAAHFGLLKAIHAGATPEGVQRMMMGPQAMRSFTSMSNVTTVLQNKNGSPETLGGAGGIAALGHIQQLSEAASEAAAAARDAASKVSIAVFHPEAAKQAVTDALYTDNARILTDIMSRNPAVRGAIKQASRG